LVRSLMDTTAPVITLKGDSRINITVGTPYVEKGATALDNKDGNVDTFCGFFYLFTLTLPF